MTKSADAFRTISEVADDLDLPQHVLRFWETRFPQIKPLKRAGGRRFYRPADVRLLAAIRQLLYGEGYTIKGVQRLLKEQGAKGLQGGARLPDLDESEQADDEAEAIAPAQDGAEQEPAGQDLAEQDLEEENLAGQAPLGHPAAADLPESAAPPLPARSIGAVQFGPGERHLLESALAIIIDCQAILHSVEVDH